MTKKLIAILVLSGMVFTGIPFAEAADSGQLSAENEIQDSSGTVDASGSDNAGDDQSENAGQEGSDQNSGKVTLDFKDADITNVLRILSIKSGVNIVAGPEVTGTVTIRLADVPWQKALEVVLMAYGYVYAKDGNIVRVTTREKVAQEDLVSEAFVLNYITAQEIVDAVKEMLTERGRIKAVTRTNTVVVTDVSANIYKISEVIKQLDKPTAQAFIDSRVVRTELGMTENLGIDWNIQGSLTGAARPTTFPFAQNSRNQDRVPKALRQFFPGTTNGGLPTVNPDDNRAFPYDFVGLTNAKTNDFSFGTLNFSQFSAAMQFLRTRANTKVMSNPRIVVLNNQTAKVQVGEQVPLPTFERNENSGSFEVTGFTYRDVGVVLNVTPHINSAEEILVDLKPEVSSEGNLLAFTASLSAPRFQVTQASTQVMIKSGETIAIGGLLTDNSSTTDTKVPLLSDIPVVGKLFRAKRQTAGSGNNKVETLFFVTVSVVDTEGQLAGRAAKLAGSVATPATTTPAVP